jgi:hypothetical protein
VTAPAIDANIWRDALPHPPRSGFDRMLIVQCSLDWLRPNLQSLREEVDDFVIKCCSSRSDLRIDRLVLHSLPTVQGARDGDLARLNAAHTEWMYRLASTSVLLHHPALHVHRMIVGGGQTRWDLEDFVDLYWDGSWLRPEQSRPVLDLLSGRRRTTPLTGYDVDLSGPFGDADPSVYV